MLYFLKESKTLLNCTNFLIVKNLRINTVKPFMCSVNFASQSRFSSLVQRKCWLVSNDQCSLILSRNKYDSGKKNEARRHDDESSDEEEEDDSDEEDDSFEGDSRFKTYNVKSLRIDSLLKAILGVSRKKIEQAFYQNKIRVNGELVHKKSQSAKLNDEIDVIKGVDVSSSDIIIIGRVKILKVELDTPNILLKVWRSKSLKVENYKNKNAWIETTEEK